jgi:hypothetical protein
VIWTYIGCDLAWGHERRAEDPDAKFSSHITPGKPPHRQIEKLRAALNNQGETNECQIGHASQGLSLYRVECTKTDIMYVTIVDEQLIQPPKPDSVRDRFRDRIMNGRPEQGALLERISYPYRAKTQHWNAPLIHLGCLKAIHRRMDCTKRQLKRS